MADVVQERGGADHGAFVFSNAAQRAALLQEGERATGQMIRAQRVLESRVRGARVHEERKPQLPHVAQPLEDRRVHQR